VKEDPGVWSLVARLGWTVVFWTVGSLLLGIWLDGVLHTSPFATLALALLGSFAAIVGVYRQATAAMNEAADRRKAREAVDERKPPETHEEEE
jgi:F0F1-type ATP synthase assembly protein I